jgi:hypothetical protein
MVAVAGLLVLLLAMGSSFGSIWPVSVIVFVVWIALQQPTTRQILVHQPSGIEATAARRLAVTTQGEVVAAAAVGDRPVRTACRSS